MSDFLSRLVARNRNADCKVQPRPRSRFESRPRREIQTTDITEPPDSIEKELHESPARVQEQTAFLTDVEKTSQSHVAINNDLRKQSISSDRNVAETAAPPAIDQLHPADTPMGNRLASQDNQDTNKLHPGAASDSKRSALNGFQPRQSIEYLPAADPEDQHSAADEPPVVRVTIGRVEVRAVLPKKRQQSRPPARSPRPGPKMSLDAYLQRNRGKGP